MIKTGEKMDNKIQIFDFQSQEIRVVMDEENNPWWIAKDVCELLGFKNSSSAVALLENNDKRMLKIKTAVGFQKVLIINDAGFYDLVFKSRNEFGKKLMRLITHKLIPKGIREIKSPIPDEIDEMLKNLGIKKYVMGISTEEGEM